MNSTMTNYLIIIVVGGFGGLLNSIYKHGKLHLPRLNYRSREITLGFFGDVLLGIGGALGVTTVVPNVPIGDLVVKSLLGGIGGAIIVGRAAKVLEEREKSIEQIDDRILTEIVEKVLAEPTKGVLQNGSGIKQTRVDAVAEIAATDQGSGDS